MVVGMIWVSKCYVKRLCLLLWNGCGFWDGLTNFGITKVHQCQTVVLSPLANNSKVHHYPVKLAAGWCVVSYITVEHSVRGIVSTR